MFVVLSLLETRHSDGLRRGRDVCLECFFKKNSVVHRISAVKILVSAASQLFTLFSAMNEASFEGALLDSLNIFRKMWISNGKSLPKDVDGKLKAEYAASHCKFARGWWLRVGVQMLESVRGRCHNAMTERKFELFNETRASPRRKTKKLTPPRGSVLMCVTVRTMCFLVTSVPRLDAPPSSFCASRHRGS